MLRSAGSTENVEGVVAIRTQSRRNGLMAVINHQSLGPVSPRLIPSDLLDRRAGLYRPPSCYLSSEQGQDVGLFLVKPPCPLALRRLLKEERPGSGELSRLGL